MITKEVEYTVTVTAINNLECKEVSVFKEDGIEVSRTPPHRSVYTEGDDVSEAPQKVQDLAAALWL